MWPHFCALYFCWITAFFMNGRPQGVYSLSQMASARHHQLFERCPGAQMQRSLTIILFRFDCAWCRRAISKTMWHERNSFSQQMILAIWSKSWRRGGGRCSSCSALLHRWHAAKQELKDGTFPKRKTFTYWCICSVNKTQVWKSTATDSTHSTESLLTCVHFTQSHPLKLSVKDLW